MNVAIRFNHGANVLGISDNLHLAKILTVSYLTANAIETHALHYHIAPNSISDSSNWAQQYGPQSGMPVPARSSRGSHSEVVSVRTLGRL